MAYIPGGDFSLPIEYMSYVPTKSERRTYFDNILEFFKTELPVLKLIYAYLAPLDNIMRGLTDYWVGNSLEDSFALKTDYVLIFKAESMIPGKPVYVIENPLFGTDRSAVGFQYCKEKGLLKEYKNVFLETATRIPCNKFEEFIYQMSYDELYEGYASRLTDQKKAKFYEGLPRSVRELLANDVKPNTDEVILDPNAKPFTGVLSMDKNFWKSKENLNALLCNLIILSSYYTKPQI